MTDKERLIKLLEDFGVSYEDKDYFVRIGESERANIGYSECVDFNFNAQGEFENMEVICD